MGYQINLFSCYLNADRTTMLGMEIVPCKTALEGWSNSALIGHESAASSGLTQTVGHVHTKPGKLKNNNVLVFNPHHTTLESSDWNAPKFLKFGSRSTLDCILNHMTVRLFPRAHYNARPGFWNVCSLEGISEKPCFHGWKTTVSVLSTRMWHNKLFIVSAVYWSKHTEPVLRGDTNEMASHLRNYG